MSQPAPGGRFEPGSGPGESGDEDEEHWAVELLGDVAMYVMVVSLALAVLGLAGLVVELQPVANILLTVGSLGATGAMGLAIVVGSISRAPLGGTNESVDDLQ